MDIFCCFRKRYRVAMIFSAINCIFIYYVISSHQYFSAKNSSSELNSKKLFSRPMDFRHDYYFRIEYTILESPCQPINTFQTVEAMMALEKMTNQRINDILSDNVTIDLQIFKINATLQHINRYNQKLFLFMERSDVVCNYILELYSGMDFPSHCQSECRSSELHRITRGMNSFDHSIDPLITFTPPSDHPIKYSIHNIFFHQTVKFYQEEVTIKSVAEEYYVTISTCESETFQPVVSMSKKSRSLFFIKKGLDLSDAASIYVSFASWSRANYYIRHENGQLKMANNDQSILFRQDSTFKLVFDQQRENCAILAINLGDYHLLAVDLKNNANLYLAKYEKKPLVIGELDRQFLFKITPNN